jgi:hypothetical protein
MKPLRQWRHLAALAWTLIRNGRTHCPWCGTTYPTHDHIRAELQHRGAL